MAIEVETQAPLAVDSVEWTLDGAAMTTVIVKASYALDAGAMLRLTTPQPLRPEHGDYAPLKPSAELLIVNPGPPPSSREQLPAQRLLGIALARGADVLLAKQLVLCADGRRVAPGEALPMLGVQRPGRRPDTPPALQGRGDADGFLVAPADQRMAFVRGGERLLLRGLLHPSQPDELQLQLPALRPHAVAGHGRAARQLGLLGDTMVVDLEARQLCVTWRGVSAGLLAAVKVSMLPLAELEEVTAAPPSWQQQRTRRPRRPHERLAVVNRSDGLQAHAFAWQRGPQDACCTLVAKGTFALSAGAPARLADEQPPLSGGPDVTDLAPYKPQAEVLLTGTAYPPEDEALALVTLTLGEVRKRVVALGERRWLSSGGLSAPQPFASLALDFRYAFGGDGDAHNPVGTGLPGTPPPRLELADRLIQSPHDRPPPACFGPISAEWPVRREQLGAFDGDWLDARWPALPEDADAACHQQAPPDQRCGYLRGDEAFEVTAVRPGGEALSGQLPGLRLEGFVQRTDGAIEPLEMQLDTVSIDADRQQLTLLWRGLAATRDSDASDIDRLLLQRASGDDGALDRAWGQLACEDDERFSGPTAAAQPLPSPAAWLAAMAALPAPMAALYGAFAQVGRIAPVPERAQIERWREQDALAGRDLTGADLRDLDLSGRDLRGAILQHAQMTGCRLDGAQLAGANLAWASASNSSWRGADLSEADASGATLDGADFSEAELSRACFAGAMLAEVSFVQARGAHLDLSDAELARARFDGAQLPGLDLTEARLDAASLREAQLDNARLYEARGDEVILDGASFVDARLENSKWVSLSARAIRARGSNWEGAELPAANLMRAELQDASMVAATLDGCILSEADARGARFRHASLREASLLRTNLMQASFEAADITGADLRGANLYQVDTHRARTAGIELELAHVAGSRLAEHDEP